MRLYLIRKKTYIHVIVRLPSRHSISQKRLRKMGDSSNIHILGRNPYPMVKAARAGAGGGRGPRFSGVGGLKPSYMTCDETGVQMPNYSQRKSTLELKKKFNLQGNKAKKRLGLIWQL